MPTLARFYVRSNAEGWLVMDTRPPEHTGLIEQIVGVFRSDAFEGDVSVAYQSALSYAAVMNEKAIRDGP